MNRILKKASFVAALSCASFVGINTAYAASASGISTQTANVVFSSPSTSTVVLTPKTNLVAGSVNAGELVATAVVSSSTGYVAYRWTPGVGKTSSSSGTSGVNDLVTLTGKNNANNSLTLTLTPSNGTQVFGSSAATGSWIIPTKTTSSIPLNITVTNNTTVAADTYVISLDAANWNN